VPLDLSASTVYPRSLSRAPVNEARTEFRKICDDLGSQEPRGVDIWTLPGDEFDAGAGLDGLELAAGLLFRVEEVVSNK
jgi:hypothetical protein